MRKHCIFKFVTFFLICFSLPLNLKAVIGHLYSSDQLSSSATNCVVQDKYGFIWTGTYYGLNRFDGYRFVQYYNSLNDTTSINSHDVISMLVTRKGELIIGCGRGLCKYDYSTNSFKRYKFKSGITPRISQIIESPNGEIYFGTAGFGIYKIQGENLKLVVSPDKEYDNGFIDRLFFDANGKLWYAGSRLYIECIGTDMKADKKSIFKCEHGAICNFLDLGKKGFLAVLRNGILRYDYSSHTFKESGYDIQALQNIGIEHAAMDSKGNLYIGTRGKGIFVIDHGTKNARQYAINKKPIMPLAVVNYITEDCNGSLWLSCFQNGLYVINNTQERFRFWNIDDKTNPRGVYVSAIASDDNSGAVIATYNDGIYHISSQGEIVEKFAYPGVINSMIRDADGRFWICGEHSLRVYDNKKNGYRLVLTDANHEFWHLASYDKEKIYYCLMGAGIGIYDNKSGENMFIGNYVSNGIEGTLCNAWVQQLMVDSHGLLWISTADGICCYDHSQKSFRTFGWNSLLHGTLCYGSVENDAGDIVIGTIKGLYLFDKKQNKLSRFPGASCLDNLHVYSMRYDETGDLWLTSSNGIWCYDNKEHQFVSHIRGNGINEKGYIQDAAIVLSDGKLAFGRDKGVVSFNSETVKHHNDKISEVHVTTFTVDGKYMDFRRNSFDIPSNNNSFTIELSMLSFENTDNVIYQYRFDNSDVWISSEIGVNSFTFNKVKPGKYTLDVRACVNGIYSPVRQISIVVASPWYLSLWAYMVYGIVVVVIALYFYRYKRQRLEARYEEQKMKFLINATHDIRSPLTLIMGPLKKLRSRVSDDESRMYIDTIGRNADRMLTLVNQILDVRKLDKKQMQIHCDKVDLVTLINGISTLFQFNARERGITIRQTSSKPMIEAYVDRGCFEKIISNLLSNAMKYSFDGGNIDIDISADKTQITIKVIDDGIGFSQKDIARLFDRFYQGMNSRGYNVGGTGIGLDLSRQLVELHGGSIKACMREDGKRGACFVISLPPGKEHLKPEQLNDADDSESKYQANNTASKNYRILVADDDIDVARYIKAELGRWYRISIVSNGNDAMNAIMNEHYDVLVSDIMMPVVDGVTLLRRIKGNPNISELPVILLTSKTEVEDRLEGLRHGADAYIAKPFSIDELHVTIDNLVSNVRRLKGKFSGSQSQEGKVENVEMKSNDDSLMESIMASINSNYTDPEFNVEKLAADLSISRVQLHRRMKEITGMSTSEFIRNIRLKQAAQLIKEKQVNVSQVAYAVGFSSHAHFSTLFKKYYGVSPKDYAENDVT